MIKPAKVVETKHALKSSEWIAKNPQARAEDLMEALLDPTIKAIITNVGGEDSIRTLPFMDLNIIRNNPKIFLGFSDSTITHFAFYKAGVTSFYGTSLLVGFAENNGMHDYQIVDLQRSLFSNFRWILRNYAASGIFKNIAGLILGRSYDNLHWQEYDEQLIKVIREEEGLNDLPIITGMDFGHTCPTFTLPYGAKAEIDCEQQTFSILENGVI